MLVNENADQVLTHVWSIFIQLEKSSVVSSSQSFSHVQSVDDAVLFLFVVCELP